MPDATTIEADREHLESLLDLLYRLAVTQEHKYGPFTNELASVRLGIAVLQDELDEALDAWRDDRKVGNWIETGTETAQVAAIAIRLLMAMGIGKSRDAWATILGVQDVEVQNAAVVS